MSKKNETLSPRTALLCLAVVIAMTAIIILSKRAAGTDAPATLPADSSAMPVARPDTAAPAGYPAAETESIAVALPDTIGKDRRPAAEAGYEDGYFSGMDDGATGHERATYDETSTFPTRAERERYAENYRKGYADGWEDGRSGKQFNITTHDDAAQ